MTNDLNELFEIEANDPQDELDTDFDGSDAELETRLNFERSGYTGIVYC